MHFLPEKENFSAQRSRFAAKKHLHGRGDPQEIIEFLSEVMSSQVSLR